MATPDKVFTPPELAKILGVTDKTVKDWATRRALPHFKTPSGRMQFYASKVAAYLKEKGMPIPPELLAKGAA